VIYFIPRNALLFLFFTSNSSPDLLVGLRAGTKRRGDMMRWDGRMRRRKHERKGSSGVARGGGGWGFKPLPLKIDVYFCGLIIGKKTTFKLAFVQNQST